MNDNVIHNIVNDSFATSQLACFIKGGPVMVHSRRVLLLLKEQVTEIIGLTRKMPLAFQVKNNIFYE